MSKTRLFQSIKTLDVSAVTALLEKNPDLIRAIDDRHRNPLHFLCSLSADPKTSGRALTLARHLLEAGLDINAPAFVEGAFQATPLWYSISRGQNLPLARLLLKHGSTPENSLWAAAFAENVEAIDLLVRSGARLDPVAEDETPFLGAIKWSRFVGAERLLRHGADPTIRSRDGWSPLDLVRNRRDKTYFELLTRRPATPR